MCPLTLFPLTLFPLTLCPQLIPSRSRNAASSVRSCSGRRSPKRAKCSSIAGISLRHSSTSTLESSARSAQLELRGPGGRSPLGPAGSRSASRPPRRSPSTARRSTRGPLSSLRSRAIGTCRRGPCETNSRMQDPRELPRRGVERGRRSRASDREVSRPCCSHEREQNIANRVTTQLAPTAPVAAAVVSEAIDRAHELRRGASPKDS